MSSCCMTSMTRFKLSMNELTATRSMRLVVARYSTCRIRLASPREKVLWTSGESSLSTCSDFNAIEASLSVGNGTSNILMKALAICHAREGSECLQCAGKLLGWCRFGHFIEYGGIWAVSLMWCDDLISKLSLVVFLSTQSPSFQFDSGAKSGGFFHTGNFGTVCGVEALPCQQQIHPISRQKLCVS